MAPPKFDQELASALSVKWLKLLMQQVETDSNPDHWQVLRDTLAKLNPIADAIIGHRTWMTLDDSAYLVPSSGRLPLKVVPSF